MRRFRKFKRRLHIGLADYSRFKSTRSAIRHKEKKNGYDRYMRSVHSEILTLNVRNKDFVKKYNKRHDLIHLTKQEMKNRLLPADIPMPLTYMVIKNKDEIDNIEDFLEYNQHTDFVIKPNRGHVGKGILIIKKQVGKRFITVTDRALDLEQLKTHIKRIIEGRFSTGKADSAIIEECIHPHKMLRNLYTNGLLDIRVISFLGFPVMAMLRLPTKRSRGKANLHRGAIGGGLSLETGEIFNAIYKRQKVECHPDTKYNFLKFKFPNWSEILTMAVRAQVISGLGFAGIDLCIDDQKGLMIMEVNKRPGLEIQIANQNGLLKRLRIIEQFVSDQENENGNDKINEISTQERIEKALFWDRNGWARL